MQEKIIVTGGSGYIGSHTVVELAKSGYDIICLDNMERADREIWNRVQEIVGREIPLEEVDLRDWESTRQAIEKHSDAIGVVHFAAYKYVSESVRKPMDYFYNNVIGLLNLLKAIEKTSIRYFLFSSSCSVYGNAKSLPVTEEMPFEEAESPYARTKQIAEHILKDLAVYEGKLKVVSLRYFNPVGAHPTYKIGEALVGEPENLFPRINLAVAGRLPQITIFGNDYPTRDGTPIRDYIHIMDLAEAHVLAMKWLIENEPVYEVFNLGTGDGLTVLEIIKAFEEYNGIAVPYSFGPRRKGDVAAVYASGEKAERVLGWKPKRKVKEMVVDAWRWHLVMEQTPYFRKRLDEKFPREYSATASIV
ncbi:MAG: UDP-glucose 4-epimerase GalE [Chlorobi bacterium]|nr:UDP-glucose 4-epimerase GalE [Chlorobiota bacterium]